MGDTPYLDALERQRLAVERWLEDLNDGFKAPELKVGMPPEVFNAVVHAIAEKELLERGE